MSNNSGPAQVVELPPSGWVLAQPPPDPRPQTEPLPFQPPPAPEVGAGPGARTSEAGAPPNHALQPAWLGMPMQAARPPDPSIMLAAPLPFQAAPSTSGASVGARAAKCGACRTCRNPKLKKACLAARSSRALPHYTFPAAAPALIPHQPHPMAFVGPAQVYPYTGPVGAGTVMMAGVSHAPPPGVVVAGGPPGGLPGVPVGPAPPPMGPGTPVFSQGPNPSPAGPVPLRPLAPSTQPMDTRVSRSHSSPDLAGWGSASSSGPPAAAGAALAAPKLRLPAQYAGLGRRTNQKAPSRLSRAQLPGSASVPTRLDALQGAQVAPGMGPPRPPEQHPVVALHRMEGVAAQGAMGMGPGAVAVVGRQAHGPGGAGMELGPPGSGPMLAAPPPGPLPHPPGPDPPIHMRAHPHPIFAQAPPHMDPNLHHAKDQMLDQQMIWEEAQRRGVKIDPGAFGPSSAPEPGALHLHEYSAELGPRLDAPLSTEPEPGQHDEKQRLMMMMMMQNEQNNRLMYMQGMPQLGPMDGGRTGGEAVFPVGLDMEMEEAAMQRGPRHGGMGKPASDPALGRHLDDMDEQVEMQLEALRMPTEDRRFMIKSGSMPNLQGRVPDDEDMLGAYPGAGGMMSVGEYFGSVSEELGDDGGFYSHLGEVEQRMGEPLHEPGAIDSDLHASLDADLHANLDADLGELPLDGMVQELFEQMDDPLDNIGGGMGGPSLRAGTFSDGGVAYPAGMYVGPSSSMRPEGSLSGAARGRASSLGAGAHASIREDEELDDDIDLDVVAEEGGDVLPDRLASRRASRIMANRLSAAKSRMKKLHYTAELEGRVKELQARITKGKDKVAQEKRAHSELKETIERLRAAIAQGKERLGEQGGEGDEDKGDKAEASSEAKASSSS